MSEHLWCCFSQITVEDIKRLAPSSPHAEHSGW